MEAQRRRRIEATPEAREGSAGAAATAGVGAAVVLAFFTQLGAWPLFDPDEGRNALVALEMARSGHYLLPTIAGLPFLDKPFLYFAAAATSIRWLGPSELAARLPSAIFALGIVAMTYARARRELGAAPARIAALACASIPLFLVFSHIAILDSCLGFFVVAAILAFERSIESCDAEGSARSRGWNAVAWVASALGVLVKGPVALLVPLLVAVPYAAWRRRSWAVWWPGGPLLLAVVLVPWLVVLEHRAPGFLRYALVTETYARMATSRLHRTEPFWYFVPFVVGAAFPWSWIAFPGAGAALDRARESFEARRTFVFLALWFLMPLLFFSLVRSKRPQYIVPLLPALALWVAWLVGGRRRRLAGVGAAAIGWLAIATASALFSLGVGEHATRLGADRFPAALGFARGFAGVAGVSGVAAWILRRNAARAAWALAAPVLLLPWLGRDLLSEVGEIHSARALARAIEPYAGADTAVVGIATYPLSAAFYLDRPFLLSSADGSPLTSNWVRHAYGALVDLDSGGLRRGDYWQRVLARNAGRTIFVTRLESAKAGATLRANGYRGIDAGSFRAWVADSESPGVARAKIERDD